MFDNINMQKDNKISKKIMKKIGGTIKFYRDKIDMSQETLALNVGVDRTYISALENGTKCASVYCLFVIAKELNIDIKDLVDFKI